MKNPLGSFGYHTTRKATHGKREVKLESIEVGASRMFSITQEDLSWSKHK
jgi:hypothetical protein